MEMEMERAVERDEGVLSSICGGCVNFHCCTWIDNCKGRQERRGVDCSVLYDNCVIKKTVRWWRSEE